MKQAKSEAPLQIDPQRLYEMTPGRRRAYLRKLRKSNHKAYGAFLEAVRQRSGRSASSVSMTLHNPQQSEHVWAAICAVANGKDAA